MVDGAKENKNANTENKGVNITSDSFPLAEDNAVESPNNNEFPSLYTVRNQLQTAIDIMGTSTPHVIYSSSAGAEADNEDSVISSTSIFSSVLQVKHVNKNREQCQSVSTCNTPRDISEISNGQESETYAMINDLPLEKPSQQPLYVPAILPPAVLCMNPSCVCAHSIGYAQQIPVVCSKQDENRMVYKTKDKSEKKHKLSNLIGKLTKSNSKEHEPATIELYKMNIMQAKDNGHTAQRFVFDRVEEAPKPEVNTVGTNTKNCNNCTSHPKSMCINERKVTCKKSNQTYQGISTHNSHYSGLVVAHSTDDSFSQQHTCYYKNLEEKSKLQFTSDKNTARVDVYYFDHGNAAYYRTTDSPPLILTEVLAEKAESYATKFWAEIFGTVYIAFAFVTSFILQLFRFILHSIIRPLTIGLLQLMSDYFFKPFLATIFNAVIQPPLIFLYNIATSLRDLCDPIAEGLGYFFREISVICRAIRLFEIKTDKRTNAEKSCKDPGI